MMESEIAEVSQACEATASFTGRCLTRRARVLTKLLDAIKPRALSGSPGSLSPPVSRALAGAHRMILDAIVMREEDLARRLMYDIGAHRAISGSKD